MAGPKPVDDQSIKNHGNGYPGNNGKCSIKKLPWKYKSGGSLENSMKEQSMNQNANQMIDWVDKFQMTRNTSSIDFVIQPGNDGFSNCEQSPNNDSWGDETHRFGRNRHLGPIFYDEQSISLIWKFKFQPSKKLERQPTVVPDVMTLMRLLKSVCWRLVRTGLLNTRDRFELTLWFTQLTARSHRILRRILC